ncbi:UDP-N-acetylmuramoyl-L-alanine--D-glutamate ligase [Thiohalocapsa marina]|uniref:UDP-N-acetylmuramoylalanine--D-glutamate ligase n=1 Tax=Thiohalocapsa marina TaxID=424902 RepID=A0A5M8FRA3_9GAMM|nr:UDP-N-acetylmuramoyl-L-alanine--D-glutamate ligase [Thiohalocapsa marina]KAA6186626.1 UDP-N-acetylmuramoyl-L-alanine--D-glutamate ligase [Thiohalocapsa marina]
MSLDATALPPAGSRVLVVGLGKTGLSCARWLLARGYRVAVTDSRDAPPGLETLRAELPDAAVMPGGLDPTAFAAADLIVLSPGVSLAEPPVAQALADGRPVIGDIELFARAATAPVVGITGSNGKSTVTTLLGLMADESGRRVAVGGNLGAPALDLLDAGVELYVLELSSFQLETTHSLALRAATVLNLSPDHLDRHGDLAGYAAAKRRIFTHAKTAVVNRDDPVAAALADDVADQLGFTLEAPQRIGDYGVAVHDGRPWIVRAGHDGHAPLLPVDELRLCGRHNLANALAALALGGLCGLDPAAMCRVLRRFRGLPHRGELVAEANGVRWINDSKGTNPGATAAALDGLVPAPEPSPAPHSEQGRAVLIAGGDCKGADFGALAVVVARSARAVVLIGRDAPRLEAALAGTVPLLHARDMDDAVRLAAAQARPGDCVLLSPACASFDMFDDYQQRGRLFAAAVERWLT